MKLLPHVAASTTAGAFVAVTSDVPAAVPVAIAAGVLPDTDHLLDFYWHYFRRSRARLFVLFHGWEFLAVMVGLLIYFDTWWMAAITWGYFTQIALDQIANKAKWYTYFFSWRLSRGFRRRESYGGDNPGLYKAFTDSLPWIGPRLEPWFEKIDMEMYPERRRIG